MSPDEPSREVSPQNGPVATDSCRNQNPSTLAIHNLNHSTTRTHTARLALHRILHSNRSELASFFKVMSRHVIDPPITSHGDMTALLPGEFRLRIPRSLADLSLARRRCAFRSAVPYPLSRRPSTVDMGSLESLGRQSVANVILGLQTVARSTE